MHDLDLIISALFCLFCSQPLQPDEQEISWSHCVPSCTKLFEEYMRREYSDQIKHIQGVPKNVLRDTGFVIAPINHLHVKLLQWKKTYSFTISNVKIWPSIPSLLHKSVCLSKNLVSDFQKHWLYCHDTINEAIILSTTNIFGTIIWLGGGHHS